MKFAAERVKRQRCLEYKQEEQKRGRIWLQRREEGGGGGKKEKEEEREVGMPRFALLKCNVSFLKSG